MKHICKRYSTLKIKFNQTVNYSFSAQNMPLRFKAKLKGLILGPWFFQLLNSFSLMCPNSLLCAPPESTWALFPFTPRHTPIQLLVVCYSSTLSTLCSSEDLLLPSWLQTSDRFLCNISLPISSCLTCFLDQGNHRFCLLFKRAHTLGDATRKQNSRWPVTSRVQKECLKKSTLRLEDGLRCWWLRRPP